MASFIQKNEEQEWGWCTASASHQYLLDTCPAVDFWKISDDNTFFLFRFNNKCEINIFDESIKFDLFDAPFEVTDLLDKEDVVQ